MNIHNNGKNITHLTIKYLFDRKLYESKRWLPAIGNTALPIHICWGNQDRVAKVEIAHYLKKEVCQKAQLTIMEGAGHFCQIGSPKTWLHSILPFYKNLYSS